jgi:hypothetical protein
MPAKSLQSSRLSLRGSEERHGRAEHQIKACKSKKKQATTLPKNLNHQNLATESQDKPTLKRNKNTFEDIVT